MEKVLALFGGPRRNGNTEVLLDTFLNSIDRDKYFIEKVILKDLSISPCLSCYGCCKDGACIIEDDMGPLYKSIKDAGIIILASPIYFASVTSITKLMIDRCQAFWSGKYIANIRRETHKKRGYFIATAGSDDANMFEYAKPTVKLFFSACDAYYSGELFAASTDVKEVRYNNEILYNASNMGCQL